MRLSRGGVTPSVTHWSRALSRRAEHRIGRHRVQRVSRHAAFQRGGRVVVLQGREQVDAGVPVLRQVVAAGVGVDQGAAPLPVLGGGLGVDDDGGRFPAVSGPRPAPR